MLVQFIMINETIFILDFYSEFSTNILLILEITFLENSYCMILLFCFLYKLEISCFTDLMGTIFQL